MSGSPLDAFVKWVNDGLCCAHSHRVAAMRRQVRISARGLSLGEVKREVITAALSDSDWNVMDAARRLRIPRTTMYKMVQRYGLVEQVREVAACRRLR